MAISEIEVRLLAIGLFIAVSTLLATFFEIRKSIKIATSNAEIAIIRDLNGWFVKYSDETESYLFSKDIVPGKINKRLLSFLRDDLAIDWAENAECRWKSDDRKTILIFKGGNSAEIKIEEEKKKATLKISDGRIHNLKVKKENGKLNIYEESKEKKFLYLQLALNSLEQLVKDVKRGIYPFDEYLNDFLPMTFFYFVELEKDKGFDYAKNHISKGHKSLLHVFNIYADKSNEFVETEGEDRTPDKLKKFLYQDNKLDDSQKTKLKLAMTPSYKYPFLRLRFVES